MPDLNASDSREPKPAGARHDDIGPKLRLARTKQGRGLRELASRLEISASALSQIELGRSMPSVRSLYAIVSELNISLDQLLGEDEARGARAVARRHASGRAVVTRSSERKRLDLDSGAHWERLNPAGEPNIDFLAATYDVGGASGPPGMFMRHPGREYGLLLRGRLKVTVAFQEHELGPGDSICFDSQIPHRLEAIGTESAHTVWVIIGRAGSDPREGGSEEHRTGHAS